MGCVREATMRPVWKKEPESGKYKFEYESASTTSPPKEGLKDNPKLGKSQHPNTANSRRTATAFRRGAATVTANSKGGAAAPNLFGVRPSSESFAVTSSSKLTWSGPVGAPSTSDPSSSASSSSIFGIGVPSTSPSAALLPTLTFGTAPGSGFKIQNQVQDQDQDSKLESAALPIFEPILGKLGFFKLEKGQLEKLP